MYRAPHGVSPHIRTLGPAIRRGDANSKLCVEGLLGGEGVGVTRVRPVVGRHDGSQFL